MSKLYPTLIVLVVIGVGGMGAYFMLNQKIDTERKFNLSQTQTQAPTPQNPQPTNTQNMDNFRTTESGLKILDEIRGYGRVVREGDTVRVNYVGTLEDGTKFDSSYDRNQPFITEIGTGQVIKGWDEGLLGMKEGGKRKLIVPANLGYGSQETGNIPPDSTLIFEIELLSIN